MTALLTLSLGIALPFLLLSAREAGGIPVSLSVTYYDWGSRGWVFRLSLTLVSLALLPVWISVSSPGHEWMAFLACASLLFVAAAPSFRLELEGKVHYTSAAVCCAAAVMWQVAEGLWDVTLWCAFIGGMLSLKYREQWCWWMECAVIASVYMNLVRII